MNDKAIDFSDLDEDLSKPQSSHVREPDEFDEHDAMLQEQYGNTRSQSDFQYVEDCPDCRGTGNFTSWSGNVVGKCFKCDGEGKRYYKTSPEARAQNRERAEVRRIRKEAATAEMLAQWQVNYPEHWTFLESNASWSDFYRSLKENLERNGELSPKQFQCVENGMEKAKARQEKAIKEAPEINVEAVRKAFNTAIEAATAEGKPNYKATLRMLSKAQYDAYRADPEGYHAEDGDLVISRAPMHGQNAGCLYVKYQGNYVGKITESGHFFKSHNASEEALASVLELNNSDLLELAVAFGKATSHCSCCGRFLENEESVKLGIGPICRAKWGF